MTRASLSRVGRLLRWRKGKGKPRTMTEEWGLYLKAAQGSQGRRQGSETIVRQVKVSDQEQLLQMAEHRQILRRGMRYPARPGRQLSAVVHQAFARCAPHRPWGTPAEDRREQLGSIPHHPRQYMFQIKDTGETKVLGPGWPEMGQVHSAGMNTDTSGRGPGKPGVGLVAAKVGSSDMIKITCWGDRLGRTTEKKESQEFVRNL